jgi:hypothetical protein
MPEEMRIHTFLNPRGQGVFMNNLAKQVDSGKSTGGTSGMCGMACRSSCASYWWLPDLWSCCLLPTCSGGSVALSNQVRLANGLRLLNPPPATSAAMIPSTAGRCRWVRPGGSCHGEASHARPVPSGCQRKVSTPRPATPSPLPPISPPTPRTQAATGSPTSTGVIPGSARCSRADRKALSVRATPLPPSFVP